MNIYDIAREAGVSISTVSRVLNNKGNVTAATRARVEEVLARSNYTPSAIARGMTGKPLHTVAVLTVDIRVPHYARTAYTIEREFGRRGYEVSLCNTGGEREETVRYLRTVAEKHADGVVLVGSVFNDIGSDPRAAQYLSGVPVVLANGRLGLPNSYSVLVDDRHGAGLAAEHLLRQGRRSLYFLKDIETASADAKSAGFLDALGRAGVDGAQDFVLRTQQSIQGGMNAVRRLVESGRPLDGIVCGDDLTAAGAVKALRRAGLRVPEDVAVTGYNDSEYARICEPALTSVDNKPELVALLCVRLLESLIEKTGPFSSVTIQPELVIRETA